MIKLGAFLENLDKIGCFLHKNGIVMGRKIAILYRYRESRNYKVCEAHTRMIRIESGRTSGRTDRRVRMVRIESGRTCRIDRRVRMVRIERRKDR